MKSNVRTIALKDIASEIDEHGQFIVAAWQLTTQLKKKINCAAMSLHSLIIQKLNNYA